MTNGPSSKRNPVISNNFPEYSLLSHKSKALLNTFRGSILTFTSSLITASIGVSEADQGSLAHNDAMQSAGHHLVELGLAGSAASVVLGALAIAGYVEFSSRDEERAQALLLQHPHE